MSKGKSSELAHALEQENRLEISGLKETLAELNLAIALNTEATKGLREVVERELGRHSRDIETVVNRTSVVETRVDNVEIAMAKASSVDKWLANMDGRLAGIELVIPQILKRLDTGDGWSRGVKWLVGIVLLISVPCAGWMLAAILFKVFGMGVH